MRKKWTTKALPEKCWNNPIKTVIKWFVSAALRKVNLQTFSRDETTIIIQCVALESLEAAKTSSKDVVNKIQVATRNTTVFINLVGTCFSA